MRLMEPIELATTPMLLAAFGGIVTELIAIRLLYARQKDNLNMQGAFWHILQTFVGSFIIIISALVIRFTGFPAIDPLLGMAFGPPGKSCAARSTSYWKRHLTTLISMRCLMRSARPTALLTCTTFTPGA